MSSQKICNFSKPEEWFHTLGTHFTEAQFIFQLNKTGVIEYLMRNPYSSSQQIAESLKLREAPLSAVLEYMAKVSELFVKNDKGFYFSDFGLQVLERYKRTDGDTTHYNLLDVRVGAYGNVWENSGALMRGDMVYGKDFIRRGEYANQGVFVLGEKIGQTLEDIIRDEAEPYQQVIELALNSGSLVNLSKAFPNLPMIGVDKKSEAVKNYKQAFQEIQSNQDQLICDDIYNLKDWTCKLDTSKKTFIYSLHFHEFLSSGMEALTEFLSGLKKTFSDLTVAIIEVPKVPDSERQNVSEVKWMYSASDVLIHELIEIGKILEEEEWKRLAENSGLEFLRQLDTKAFSFKAFLYK